MSYFLKVTEFPDEVCHAIDISDQCVGLIYEIIVASGHQNPIYCQEIYIPKNNLRLHISETANMPEYWAR